MKDRILFNIIHYSLSAVFLIPLLLLILLEKVTRFRISYTDDYTDAVVQWRYSTFKYYYDKHTLFDRLRKDAK